MMCCAITNLPLLLRIRRAECPEVGLRWDSSSAGRRFDPYTAHQMFQPLPSRRGVDVTPCYLFPSAFIC